MQAVIDTTTDTVKLREQAHKNAMKEAEATKKRVEREMERQRKEQIKAIETAKKEKEKQDAEAKAQTSSLRYEAYKEIYPNAKVTAIKPGATAAKYEHAIKQIKLQNALKTGPESLHMVGGLLMGMYTNMVTPVAQGGMGINPLRHTVRVGNTTLTDHWASPHVKETMRQPFTELIAEHPEWFVDTPALLKVVLTTGAVVEQFSAVAKGVNSMGAMPKTLDPNKYKPEHVPEEGSSSDMFSDLRD